MARNVLWVFLFGSSGAWACSHFTMNNDYIVSARTEDLPGAPHFELITRPCGSKGLRASKYGYLAFQDSNIRSGMNTAGLNCDKQTLGGATHPPPSKTLDNIDAAKICQWALEGFGNIAEMKLGLKHVNFIKSLDPKFSEGHWAFRDASGQGLVLEFTNHTMQVYEDNNDGGKTGYGIMTNEPPFPEHLRSVADLAKKERADPSAVQVPGSWDSVDRFNRIFLIKLNLPRPGDVQEAVMQAVQTLNSVSRASDFDLFHGGKTQWAAVYDHRNLITYWRTHTNQNMQRVRLADMDIAEGGVEKHLLVNTSRLPWFNDASSLFQPSMVV